jgi:hypothetical protein
MREQCGYLTKKPHPRNPIQEIPPKKSPLAWFVPGESETSHRGGRLSTIDH